MKSKVNNLFDRYLGIKELRKYSVASIIFDKSEDTVGYRLTSTDSKDPSVIALIHLSRVGAAFTIYCINSMYAASDDFRVGVSKVGTDFLRMCLSKITYDVVRPWEKQLFNNKD